MFRFKRRARNGRKKMPFNYPYMPWFGPPMGMGGGGQGGMNIEDFIHAQRTWEEFLEQHKFKEDKKKGPPRKNQPNFWITVMFMTVMSPIIGPVVRKLIIMAPTIIQ